MSLGLQEAVPRRQAKQSFWGERLHPGAWLSPVRGHHEGLSCGSLIGDPASPTRGQTGSCACSHGPRGP